MKLIQMVKQATKGQKEIYEENKSTIAQYSIASAISIALYFSGCWFLWECNSTSYIFFGVTVFLQILSIFSMRSLAGAKVDEKGHVIDAGADLNDPEALGEYCKDAIILTVITQIISLYSNFGFLLLLAFPASIGYKFVFTFLLPWLTAGSETEEVDDKKQRKMERKREKVVYRR